ncbi:MAG TPA: recombinase family protein [Mucilaginibacter sp.]|nr:recombinase family protein [Mucilaginibacter sp.]
MNQTKIEGKKAVIYCRVSTKEQVDDGNSLVSQERICREYAKKEGFEVIEVFIEKGESAKTADRTELKRLISFCTQKKGNAHAVIAYKVDRISRSIADYSHIRVLLKKYGVEIKSVTEYFEDTPAGRFMENIIANVGQFDNDVRTERSVGGMREAVNEGRYVWMAPVGYDNAKVNGKSTIIQNAMAPLVKESFELIAQRLRSPEEVRLLMVEKGLVGREGNKIVRSRFYTIIRNPLYKGTIKKFGMAVQGTFEPIVTEELFNEVQNILKGKNRKVKYYLHENPDFPLRRFVVNEHGKQLTGYWSKGKRLKYPYYSFHLKGTTIRKEVLERKFMDFLAQYEFDDKYLNTIRHYLKVHFEERLTSQGDGRKVIEQRITEINDQIDKLIDLQTNGGISLNLLTERTKKLENELEDLQDLLKNRVIKEFDIAELFNFAVAILKEPHILWQKSPFEIKKKLQVFDFPHGIVFNGINFRTPKICNIFKLKDVIPPIFDQVVPSQYTGKNTVSKTKLPPLSNFLQSKEYWEQVVDELKELKDKLEQKEEKQEISYTDKYWWMN